MRQLGEDASPFLQRVAPAPAVLRALDQGSDAARAMSLPPATRAAVALRVAHLHGCDAPSADLDEARAERCRNGLSDDAREQALLALATKVVLERGRYLGFVLQAARSVGASEAHIVETVALAGLHTFECYLRTALHDDGGRCDGRPA